MLNSSKILLLLPDVAFVAELLPQKKPHTFGIQSCSQFNSPFYHETTFNPQKLQKLFSKLEKDGPYQLVLADSLFSNEIVSIQAETDAAIKEEIKSTVLPKLEIGTDTHEIITTVLNQHKGLTRVQITAIEKSILGPIRAAADAAEVSIDQVMTLSWSLKGMVSLEPSVTVAQLGGYLYIAQHYIGVTHTVQASAENLAASIELIKSFKATEPSTMTVYLLSNELIETELKESLKQIIPLQQMATAPEEGAPLPVAVSAAIETMARTISIPDFPVPYFSPGKVSKTEQSEFATAIAATAQTDTATEDEEDVVAPQGDHMTAAQSADPKKTSAEKDTQKAEKETKTESDKPVESTLPKPTAVTTSVDTTDEEDTAQDSAKPSVTPIATGVVAAGATQTGAASGSTTSTTTSNASTVTVSSVGSTATPATSDVKLSPAITPNTTSSPNEQKAEAGAYATTTPQSAIDLAQFAGGQSGTATQQVKQVQSKDGGKSMMKMILITLGVFIVTVALGVGVGLLILRFSNQPSTTTPTVTVQPTPVVTPEPTMAATDSAQASGSAIASGSAQPAASTDATKKAMKILVVNATTKAGYAGTIKEKLVAGGFTNTSTGNAKGTYEEAGNFVFVKSGDSAIIDDLEKASGLTFTEDETIAKAEDAAGAYAVVIVLNE